MSSLAAICVALTLTGCSAPAPEQTPTPLHRG